MGFFCMKYAETFDGSFAFESITVLAGLGTMIIAGVLHFYLMRGHGGSPGAEASAPRRDSSFDGGGAPSPSSIVGIDVVSPSTPQSTLPFISFGLINANLSLAVKSAIDSTLTMARAPLLVLVSIKSNFTRIVVEPINEQFTRCSLGFELVCKRIGSSAQRAMECGVTMFCLPHAIWSTLSPLPTRLGSSAKFFFLSGFDQVAKKSLMLSGSFRTFAAATFQSWLVGVQVLKDNTSLIVANGVAQLNVGLLECEVRLRSVFNMCFQAGVGCWNYLGLILSNFLRQCCNTASVW